MEKGERLTWKRASEFPVHIDNKRQKHLSRIKMAHQEKEKKEVKDLQKQSRVTKYSGWKE
jgi:hypothetical protein